MDVKCDFSDVDDFFDVGEKEVLANEALIGKEAVEYAKENGNYKDHTGRLRSSNECVVDETGISFVNAATNDEGTPYASFVEAKGFDVLSGAALYAEEEAKKEFER